MDLNTITSIKRPQDLGEISEWNAGCAWLAGGTWLFSEPQVQTHTLVDLETLNWPSLTVTDVGLEIASTCRVIERTGGMPVIGVGGIRSADDARQYLRAGAALVAIGTAGLASPRLPERIARELERDGA